ncbi:MAG: type II secretion system protein N [Pseudomonadota bacterium]
MIGIIWRVCLVGLVALLAAVLTLPLSVATDRLKGAAPGIQWTQVQGTVWSGRISNVSFGRQMIGDVKLRLKPMSLLSGSLSYDVDLMGPVAAGTATVFGNSSTFGISQGEITARVEQMIGLNASVRQAGGIIRFRDMNLEMTRGLDCETASGRIWTEVLVNVGAEYGEDLPELDGEVSCEAGMLDVGLNGESASAVRVDIDARVGLREASRLDARIGGVSGELGQALSALGFTVSDGDFVYARELSQ